MTEPQARNEQTEPKSGEPDFSGLGKRHPYVLYLAIVGGLFLFLIVMAFLALQNDWIPSRGIGH